MHRITTSTPRQPPQPARDHGAILILVLVITLVLSIIVASLATYVTTGLRSTHVSKDRNTRIASADATLRMGIEELKLNPSLCTNNMTIPTTNNTTNHLQCTTNGTPNSAWTPYLLTATTQNNGTTTAQAAIQIATTAGTPCTATCTITINTWSVST
jgi:Tfp pilus assembly protein PilX